MVSFALSVFGVDWVFLKPYIVLGLALGGVYALSGVGVVDGKREPLRLEERHRLRRDALHRDRVVAGREEVRVRPDPDIDDGVARAVPAWRVAPAAPLAGAVLAVADPPRMARSATDEDRHGFPVAFVGLPDEVIRRIVVAIEVVVGEIPILNDRDSSRMCNSPVDDALRLRT